MKRGEIDTAGKTESFLSRNVRLITFLVCVCLFLAGALVAGAMIYGDLDFSRPENDTRPEMSVEELRGIAARAKTLTGGELSRYRGENYDRQIDGVTVEKYYYINAIGGRYNLSATERASDGRIMYLTVYDLESKKQIDLLDGESDFDAFLGD